MDERETEWREAVREAAEAVREMIRRADDLTVAMAELIREGREDLWP